MTEEKDLFEDLFDNPENYPEDLVEIVNEMDQEASVLGLTYESLSSYRNRCEMIGYTFDYYLDAVPFDLKKISNTNKNQPK